jgi:hypothetical protein
MRVKPMIINITFRVDVGDHRSPEELGDLISTIKALIDGFNTEIEIKEIEEIS